MAQTKAASRYAKALIDLSIERDALEPLKNDMMLFRKVVDENPQLEAILQNPIVPLDKKLNILLDTFGKHVHEVVRSFFTLIVKKGRAGILFETSKQFIVQYNKLKKIVTADVTVATPLTDTQREEIIASVKRDIGASEVHVVEKIDESLIGGFILRVGDKQFDASIQGGLNKLKKEFASGIAL